ncbi:MAG: fused MFS/spermidine synthase, partial [Verrucomicrobiae bacterium]|nr:fused MFS/spermidine synthase [Verrucomicrobiae bacterium]
RMLLPMLGGAPAVWNTAMMFYQGVLLAGYAAAHWFTQRLPARAQLLSYLGVAAMACLTLPVGVPKGWVPPPQNNPIPWLLMVMLVSVGLPFFTLSVVSPALQRWLVNMGEKDPYWLYAASNIGSLAALLAYPSLVEPNLGLIRQSKWWSVGFVALVILLGWCGWQFIRQGSGGLSTQHTEAAAIPLRRRLRWMMLAFAPCSLMLSVTSYLTSSIAPVPLLWVVPLAVYLLTFVLVFARRRVIPHRWMLRAMPVVLAGMPWTMSGPLLGLPMEPMDVYVVAHIAVLFVVAMTCHGELANGRPAAVKLTQFYLWVAFGGALGGVFNAVLAPLAFPGVWEYPITVAVACALLPGTAQPQKREWLLHLLWATAFASLAAVIVVALTKHPISPRWLQRLIMFGLPAALCWCFYCRPVRMALCFAAVMVGTMVPLWGQFQTVYLARSFFGIHHVTRDAARKMHYLKHGTTIHGIQSLEPERRREPLSYFSRSGPLGELIAAIPSRLKRQVAVVGLGAGTVACYAEEGEEWTFFEIDPVVERIARDPRCFTYLADCPAKVQVVLGDARLSLQREADGRFGLMILDPYNSDTPPLHLLTREALALYARKLAPDGVMAFHISSTHLDLKSVLANLAQDAGLFALHLIDFSNAERMARGETPSRWVVMTPQPRSVEAIARTAHWRRLRPQPAVGVWTDDYVSLFRVWSWGWD